MAEWFVDFDIMLEALEHRRLLNIMCDNKTLDECELCDALSVEDVEAIAEYQRSFKPYRSIIESEAHLSALFDNYIAELNDKQLEHDLKNDEPLLSECFNSYTDNLASDGILHQEQLNNYCYVGKFSD